MPRLRIARPTLPRSLSLAALSGVALWASFPPLDVGPVALVALVPLLWVIREVRPRRAAFLGLVFGGVHAGLQLLWLTTQSWLAWGGYSALRAAWAALALGLIALAWREERPIRSAFAAGAIWAAMEWLGSVWPFDGISWSGLGVTQHDNPLLLPGASVIGALGLSFLVAAINALVVVAVTRQRGRVRVAAVAMSLAVLPVAIPLPDPSGPAVDVAIVQGNVPESIGLASRIIEDRIVAESHARLTRSLAAHPPDLVVWPENALDDDPTRNPELEALVFDAVTTAGAPTLIGAITTDPRGRLYNEDLLYDRGGRLVGRYRKNHILPFGEYVPFRRYLRWLPDIDRVRDDLSPGTAPGRFRIPGASFAAVICFENNFPELVRRFVTQDAGFIVVSTNNANFGRTAQAQQHVALSELRAVENGRWVVHAALSGVSAFVDQRGRVHGETGLFVPAILRARVPQGHGHTVFGIIGGWLTLGYLLGAAAALLAVRRPPPRKTSPPPAEPRVAVILPTYNEQATVAEAVRRALAVGERIDVIVVDDSSPDGTGGVVRALGEDRVTLVERPGKQGLASAYRDGFRRALDGGYDLIVEMDADLSHRAEDLPGLLAAAQSHDLVVGSRYIPGGSVRNWGLLRRLLSRGGNLYARLLLGLPVRDATSGYRVFRRELLEELLARGIATDGYAFQVELAYRAWQLGYSVGEAPITFEERRAGESKLSQGIVAEALWNVLRWGIRDRFSRARSARWPAATAGGSPSPGGAAARRS